MLFYFNMISVHFSAEKLYFSMFELSNNPHLNTSAIALEN